MVTACLLIQLTSGLIVADYDPGSLVAPAILKDEELIALIDFSNILIIEKGNEPLLSKRLT